jgi:hypothetical protein
MPTSEVFANELAFSDQHPVPILVANTLSMQDVEERIRAGVGSGNRGRESGNAYSDCGDAADDHFLHVLFLPRPKLEIWSDVLSMALIVGPRHLGRSSSPVPDSSAQARSSCASSERGESTVTVCVL